MDIFAIQHKTSMRMAKLYTLLLRSSFKRMGKGTIIFFPVRVDFPQYMAMGERCRIMGQAWITMVESWFDRTYTPYLELGDGAIIGANVKISVASTMHIGENAAIGLNCIVTDHFHDYTYCDQPILYGPLSEPKPVTIGPDSYIAANTVIAPGTQIGRQIARGVLGALFGGARR